MSDVRNVQIELEIRGLTPEASALVYIAVRERIDEVLDMLGYEIKGEK